MLAVIDCIEHFKIELQKGSCLLEIGDLKITQRFCEFVNTYRFIASIDLDNYFWQLSSDFDYIIVPLNLKGQSIKLDLASFAKFKEKFEECMYYIRLKDLLTKNKITVSF
jgi:hypothetical protein